MVPLVSGRPRDAEVLGHAEPQHLCLRAALGYLNGNPFSYKILHARAQNVAYHVEWPALISPAAIMAVPLMKVFPAEVEDSVIAQCGRTEQRRRSLPARSMAYFAMGMALHSEGSYEDVLALISDGLAWAHREQGSGKLANKAAISHARGRLGPEPMALLFERVAKPLAATDTPGCWLAGRRLVAVDGTCLDLPDTPANDSHFGRTGAIQSR